MIKITTSGSFKNLEAYLKRKTPAQSIMKSYAERGLAALKAYTPVDSGLTAEKWGYKIFEDNYGYTIEYYNDNMAGQVPVAVLLQYGHATRGGTYVQGVDYINPALQPIFEDLSAALWKEVSK